MKIKSDHLYDSATEALLDLAQDSKASNLVIVFGDDADGDHSRCWQFDSRRRGIPRGMWREMNDRQRMDRTLRVAAALHTILKEA